MTNPEDRMDERLNEEPWENGEPVRLDVTDVLDLHTFAPRDILPVVEAYLEEARAKGFETVRIIHGKGKGVQRARVQAALSRTPFVESFQDAPLGGGSWGATIVWFRPKLTDTEEA